MRETIKNNGVMVNEYWNKKSKPFITVITPVYNRRSTILRTINSVDNQSFQNIEYIIIDDGSSETIDDIIQNYMKSTKLPVMFIKKTNGGVHTARNIGYKNARGEMVLCVDSDDELMPDACKIFYKTWKSIPKTKRKNYWQIKAQCIDQDGKRTAKPFPDNINNLPKEKTIKYFSMANGEQIGCRVSEIMKNNLFPEPKGITFVIESIVWIPLEYRYNSWGINDVVRVYHKEGKDRLAGNWRENDQQKLRNSLWSRAYMLNNKELFTFGYLQYIKNVIKYCVVSILLLIIGDKEFVKQNSLNGMANNYWKIILWIPSAVYVLILKIRQKMKKMVILMS